MIGVDPTMSRVLTASDRSALIRLASTMPVGSEERKAILAGLAQSPARVAVRGSNVPGKHILDNAQVYGDAMVSGNAKVYGNAKVAGDAKVYGLARVYGNAKVYENAKVYGDAKVYGSVQVLGNAVVYGDAQVYGNAVVYENAKVAGDAKVYGKARIGGDAVILGGEWDGSEGEISSGTWKKAPVSPQFWWQHTDAEQWESLKAALDRNGVKDYTRTHDGFSIPRRRGGTISYEISDRYGKAEVIVYITTYHAEDPRGGYSDSREYHGSGSTQSYHFDPPGGRGLDLEAWSKAVMVVYGNTSFA